MLDRVVLKTKRGVDRELTCSSRPPEPAGAALLTLRLLMCLLKVRWTWLDIDVDDTVIKKTDTTREVE